MRWVTHENVQIARLASAWLIRRFVDGEAEFAFVPRGTAPCDVADGTPFHMNGAQLANHEERGTFEVIVDRYGLAAAHPALAELGLMVRAADRIHSKVAFRGEPMQQSVPLLRPHPAALDWPLRSGDR